MNLVRLIADDLTGALDGGSPFAGRGLPTELCVANRAAVAATHGATGQARVLVASTASRRLPAARAVRCVAGHLQQMPVAPGTLLVKKIDSLLRGPYAAELCELMRVTGRRVAVISPALPRLDRLLRGGRLWADGRELADGHLIAGEVSSALPLALARAFPDLPHRQAGCDALPALPADGLLVVDAATDADLDALVEHYWAARGDVVWVGSSGLTQALARRLAGQFRPAAAMPSPSGVTPLPAATALPPVPPLLLVIGSRTDRAREQTRRLFEWDGWRHDLLRGKDRQAPPVRRAVRASAMAAVAATVLRPPEQEMAGEAAAAVLAEAAMGAVFSGVRSVAVVGGETLAALMARLDPVRVRVLGPATAGFEAISVSCRQVGAELSLYTRSGSFGAPGDLWTLCNPVAGL